jgi:regulator of protease activity HflC (stomatin/prohibitin superfamily)
MGYTEEINQRVRFFTKISLIGVAAIIFLIVVVLGWPLVTVDSGHRGVVTRWGAVQPVPLGEGMSVVFPFSDKVHEVDVQIHKYEVLAPSASKDLQDVKTVVAVNFNVMPAEAAWVYQNLRGEYTERVIAPAVQEVVKSATAKFDAAELIQRREYIKDIIKEGLTSKLRENRLHVSDVSIVNFEFSPSYAAAIEAKQVAEQSAKKAENDLTRIKVEAQQTIENAKAQAEMLRLQREQITPMMLELEAIKKWDGVLPQYIGGGATPFIDVTKLKK